MSEEPTQLKTAVYTLGDATIRVAVASGTASAKELLRKVESGEESYDFIEIMGCPGAASTAAVSRYSRRGQKQCRFKEQACVYTLQATKNCRVARVMKTVLSSTFMTNTLVNRGSHKAHEILHTHYVKRGM